jgi:RsiW-degrading membrane proteinase PrsW (M82 family)
LDPETKKIWQAANIHAASPSLPGITPRTGASMYGPSDPRPRESFDSKRPGGDMKSSASSEPTRSQLLPMGGQWQELMSKPYFVPGAIACLTVALLFALMGNPAATMQVMLMDAIPVSIPLYTVVLALCITAGGAFSVYRMAGKPKAWWLMPLVALCTALLAFSPVMGMLQSAFGFGGGSAGKSDSVIVAFVKMFFAAGLPEETLKAVPVVIGAFLGWKFSARRDASSPARQLSVLDPLDGILIGAASGFGFAFAETIFLYVPRTIVNSPQTVQGLIDLLRQLGTAVRLPQDTSQLQDIYNLYTLLSQKIGVERATFELQQLIANRQALGLQLMIPRLLSDVFGHAGYAGILGYFIGLAAMKPQGRVKTVLIGLAVAATIHAMWDSMAGSLFMYFLLSMLAFVGLAVTIMKARTISPDRSQLVASQIIDRFSGSHFSRGAVPEVARPTATPRPAPAAPSVAPSVAPQAVNPAASITWDDPSNLRYIEVGTTRLPATVGARLYERNIAGAHASGHDGVIAEVSANPSDPNVLGLKNLADKSWHVTTAIGQQRELAPGRSIRLEAGLKIRIGEMVAHVR